MGKIIDVNTIGLRKVVRDEVTTIVDQHGNKSLGTVEKTYMEAQPILTEEEAMILVEENWSEAPETFPCKFMVSVSSRRFMCDYDPSAKVLKKGATMELEGARWKVVKGYPQGLFMCVIGGQRYFTDVDVAGELSAEQTTVTEQKKADVMAELAQAKADLKKIKGELQAAKARKGKQ